jgi:hypothetical protein
MNRCPHCKSDPCLPLWRKLALGPTGSAHCQVCGYRVGANVARAWLAMSPTLVLVIAAGTGLIADPILLSGLLILCLTLMFTLYAVWVPLMPDELTTAGMVEAGRARIAAKDHPN